MKIFLPLLLISFFCHGELVYNKLQPVDLPPKAYAISYKKDGSIKQVTTSQWIDRVKSENGGRVYRKFEQGYNYDKKQGFNLVYNNKDEVIEERWSEKTSGGVCQEELLLAFDLFKKDKTVQSVLAEKNESISIYGGFNFIDDGECEAGNRCVRVFASSKSHRQIIQSIIRLNDLKVVFLNVK